MDFQREKDLVRDYHSALDARMWSKAAKLTTQDCTWRGYHPFGALTGPEAVVDQFWKPLHTSLRHLQRREDLFFAGLNERDDFSSTWVASMGHLVGLFDEPFLGIPATGRLAFLRYGTFLRVDGDHISEIAFFFDLPHLMVQAGVVPFPHMRGAQLVQPGPSSHDGLLYEPSPAEEGKKTRAAINAMIADLGTWQSGLPLEEELARSWIPNMLWWGPTGIGATYTIPRYARQHAGPFRAAFSERTKTNHVARIAEGHFGGFFGWPNFTARLTTPYQGHPTANAVGEFRVIDFYRREGAPDKALSIVR
ncbi:MAG: nuclear transport factor 2 family protein [Pseudomonadota bacterium]